MDSPPLKTDQRGASQASGERVTHAGWSLTPEAFEKLLAAFSPECDEANTLYLKTHVKLVRFFEWHACADPEHLVDVTLNRAARKLIEGQTIDNLIGYVYGVARLVFMETLKEQERAPLPLDNVNVSAAESTSQDETREAQLDCLDHCLEQLPPESRALILGYYLRDKPAKKNRNQLAARLGIPLNALRIRAHRIRAILEKCVLECVGEAV